MGRKEYLEKRQGMLNEAKQLINSGKIDEGNKKMDEIKALDERFDAEAKANAALEAMENVPQGMNLQNLTDAGAEGRAVSAGTARMTEGIAMNGQRHTEEKLDYSSEAYKTAWAKSMMGKPLSAEEDAAYKMVNEAFTHTTGNTGTVIPKVVTAGIWQEIGEIYPYWNDISKTYVNGILTMIKADTSTDAKWYDEATKTEDGKETFETLTLNGCELSRAITVSWKLKEMAMDEFLPYIQKRMAEKMGAALGYGSTHGKGQPGAGETFKAEPLGVVTALEKETGTPQIAEYVKGTLGYTDIITVRAKVKSGYAGGLSIYANSNTIWTELANVKDQNGRPILIADVSNGGAFKVLGMAVKEDDSMQDGEILMSNAPRGYTANINKEISVTLEEHVKDRITDYCAYAIVDGAMVTSKAHALLKYKAGE
ncbi:MULTISPECIES: phage major capsid protein [Blautia]|uniref:phage major capsid protein n=1 Tax=Blautia TaxID=572511 RepID=UPI000BA3D7F9|nr:MULTISPECIES: phage major capsid protein [Blautia]